jgi:glycine cleavage system aminomethyltransferase T
VRRSIVTERSGSTTLYFGPWYRKGPFFDAATRSGCNGHDIYNHMYLPASYGDGDPVEEYWALLNGVTLWDVSVERIVEITGPDALRFTDMLTPRDLSSCAPGRGRYVVITAESGGIVNDPVLLRLAEDRFWLAAADSDLLLWAKGVAVYAKMDVEIREPDASALQIQGPKAKDVVHSLLGDLVLGLGYYHCAEMDLHGIPFVISRTGWTGEIGYELYLTDRSRGDELWDRILEAGRPYDIRPIAPSDARRVEAGIFNYGSDLTLETTPLEVTGLERMVDAGKDRDYVGRQALERQRTEGVRHKLVGVEIGGEPLVPEATEFWPVIEDARRIGHATVAVYSPRLEKNIGYVWVPIERAELGTALRLETEFGDTRPARVARIPFVDPSKEVPRG